MSSSIKGGGRATLSPDAEEMIVSLLYDTRQHDNPLLQKTRKCCDGDDEDDNSNNNVDSSSIINKINLKDNDTNGKKNQYGTVSRYCDLSNHDKKKERKKFLKRLVKCHNHNVLAMKLNGSKASKDEKNSDEKQVNGNEEMLISKRGSQNQKPKSEKVRLDIVEAIFKDGSSSRSSNKSKKASSSKSSKSKEKGEPKWKEGKTRKTIVISRSTKIKDFLTQCKAKLNMKKPTRVFYVDKETKLEMDLTVDLSGLDDGAIVFATSHEVKGITQPSKIADNIDQTEHDEDMEFVDTLASVKKAYDMQQRMWSRKVERNISYGNRSMFANHLESLEDLPEERSKLPAAQYRSDILTSLDTSRVVVICGATGCGKSTQVPQYILEGMKAIGCKEQANILCTQPRRVAATSLAMRVSNERSCPPPGRDGSEIGYNVRLSKAVSDSTKITYCTVGVLLRMLVNSTKNCGDMIEDDKSHVPLSEISHIIIDEVHERDLNTDFALTLLRPLLVQNKHISIVLMSATASSELFVNYFRSSKLGIDPKVFQIPGRTFPVETKWLLECERLISRGLEGWNNDFLNEDLQIDASAKNGVKLSPRVSSKIDYGFITQLIKKIIQEQWTKSKNNDQTKTNGAILVFLPGKGEIQSLKQTLLKDSILANNEKCSIRQLHSSLPAQEQWLAFQPVKSGKVKIVLATNVAETSITIPDISFVIDTGRVKESRYNSSTRIRELVTVWTSQASSKQRAGRAGRTGPGVCYKLYSEEFAQRMMLLQTPPEIVRAPLEELVLQVLLLKEHQHNKGASPVKFLSSAPEPPNTSRLHEAFDHLLQIGAITSISDEDESLFRLTPLGYHLSHLPMDAKVGKILVVGCVLNCVEPALTIAAALSCTKTCWLPYVPGVENSTKEARELQEQIIRNGFGGENWSHGTVKGDLIGVIAAYNEWHLSGKSESERKKFANQNALDNNSLLEMKGLRQQFKDTLLSSGLWVQKNVKNPKDLENSWINSDKNGMNNNNMDALLTSCCLVAGLYPNIATLMRPSRERKIYTGCLITKDGDSCFASSSSFQGKRMKKETGKDAYAVYHGKHRTVGATDPTSYTKAVQRIFLSEINFVSRFAILLFGGEIEVFKNFILVDHWLKFKIVDENDQTGEKSATQTNAILIQELRNELDNVMLKRIVNSSEDSDTECERVIEVVRKLLSEE